MQGMDKPLHFIAVLYIYDNLVKVVIQTVLLKMVRARKRKTND